MFLSLIFPSVVLSRTLATLHLAKEIQQEHTEETEKESPFPLFASVKIRSRRRGAGGAASNLLKRSHCRTIRAGHLRANGCTSNAKYMGKFKPVWTSPRAMLGYAVAFLSVAATVLVARLQFNLQAAPVSLFLCAIMFTAWIGGLKAGVLALMLSLLSFKYYFLAPVHSLALDSEEIPRLFVFTLAAAFVLAITGAQKRSEEKLRKTARELQTNIEDLNRTQHELHKAQAELAHMTRVTTMGELTASIAHEVNQPLTGRQQC